MKIENLIISTWIWTHIKKKILETATTKATQIAQYVNTIKSIQLFQKDECQYGVRSNSEKVGRESFP